MNYRRVDPSPDLSQIIQCFWSVDDGPVVTPHKQKIIPDGYPELIFHFGDPYRIRLGRRWETQAMALVAGQIKRHFFLENTGRSHILGVKLKPSTLTHLFGLNMDALTDRVLDMRSVRALHELADLQKILHRLEPSRRLASVENFFLSRKSRAPENHPADVAIARIFNENGVTGIHELASGIGYSERYLERMFTRFVGLTPKFFARVVRFSYIFQCITDGRPDWSDIVFQSGFYDQSHFIRNFKSFTGEDPSKYLFSKQDMANFFLKKKTQPA